MKIESAGFCRANKKIYEKLVISEVADNLTIAPYMSHDEGDSPLPSRLYHLQGEEYVSVYPNLPVESVVYAIGAFDAEGKRIDSAKHRIDFEEAKKQARENRLSGAPVYDEITLYDENHDEVHAWGNIELVRFFGRPAHAQCRTIINLRDTASADLRVAVLNRRLKCIDDSYTLIGEEPQTLAGDLPAPGNSISTSFKIPWGSKGIFIVVWSEANPDFFAQLFIPAQTWRDGVEATNEALYDIASPVSDYDKWFREHRLTPYEASMQKRHSFNAMPLFSVIVPLYKTPVDLFDAMLGSLLAQTYQNWECVLVNSTPEDKMLAARVAQASENDARVRVVTLEKNLGISLNTNAGIAVAKGDFICFFDHDDTIEPDLLFEYAKEVNEHPDTNVLYCDEDKLSEDGVYCEAVFKTDFNLDMLCNNNFICHMLCIRKSLLETLEPNTKDLDGAQDHSLTLQAVESGCRVGHIAKILYHWRKAAGSTASGTGAKPYAIAAGILGVQKHLQRVGLNGTVTSDGNQTIYKVKYDVPEGEPLVSIIIPNTKSALQLKRCIESIEDKSTYANYEIIVVAPAGETSVLHQVEQFPHAKTAQLQDDHYNFAKAVNYGRSKAAGKYLLLLGAETEVVSPDWIERMLGNCARPEIGAAGAKLCYPDDIIYDAGVVIDNTPWHACQGIPKEHWAPYHSKLQRNVSAVPATCCMVAAEKFDEAGGFTETFANAFADVDFCLKLQEKGELIVYLPDVELYCFAPISRNLKSTQKHKAQRSQELVQLRNRWPEVFAGKDPYYSKGMAKMIPGAEL